MTRNNGSAGPPALKRDPSGDINTSSLADVIEWFLTYDQRTGVIRHQKVEEIFHWKQAEAVREGEEIYRFDHAEDRLAIGIMQALVEHNTESGLHDWMSQLLNALDDAAKTNEEMATAYKLKTDEVESTVKEAEKIPTLTGRKIYLTCCWLEVLCTAELRIMGWIYQELYGKPYAP
jgi:flagellar motility protein MotE (MotC chaperone)